jgi:hypothetical protein
MYGAGIPVLLFLILAAWGLKDEDVSWTEVGIAAAVIAVSAVVVIFTGQQPVLIAVPAVAVDVWLLYELDILNAPGR